MNSPRSDLWCCQPNHEQERTNFNEFQTVTSNEQMKVEASIGDIYNNLSTNIRTSEDLVLDRRSHLIYLKSGLQNLPRAFECLDASRAWLVYWSTHAIHLLGKGLDEAMQNDIIDFLDRCQSPEGGFGGGPDQLPHLAPTYAAVNALITIGTSRAYQVIRRQELADFLSRMVTKDGAFRMHEGGEVDIRGTYCAVAVAKLTKLALMPLFANTPRWIVQCQTYEGGFSGSPGLEAHGGYSFCGMAALVLLNAQHLANTSRLLRWVASRQMRYSGGFQGRTNKLVDGCYSFWQGALFPLLHQIVTEDSAETEQYWLFHCQALQNYLLACCQYRTGGLLDKPGKKPDMYHTCYTLSGLSIAQHFCYRNINEFDVVGPSSNELELTHPLYNILMRAVVSANDYFSKLPALQPRSTLRDSPLNTGPPKDAEAKATADDDGIAVDIPIEMAVAETLCIAEETDCSNGIVQKDTNCDMSSLAAINGKNDN